MKSYCSAIVFLSIAATLAACGGGDFVSASSTGTGTGTSSPASNSTSTSGLPNTANTTGGNAANGTPVLALSNCQKTPTAGQYWSCNANAIANFSSISLIDAIDGKTCTASYANGILTVTKGALSISSLINGNTLSMIQTLGSGASETVGTVSGYYSAGLNVNFTYVTWNAAGKLINIKGTQVVLTGGGQELQCSQV
jgi:hypothetical protein